MSDKMKTGLSRDDSCFGVPSEREERLRLREAVRDHIAAEGLVAPVSLSDLKKHAQAILQTVALSEDYLGFSVVVLNNELWRGGLIRIPFEKRLLLLPQCLKHSEACPAEIDHLGLICKHCGRCVIDRISRRAEELGYAVLIAEGSPVVMAMIESGQVQATLGVSCLSVLERVFPYMEAAAVPGVAIPLLKDGCKDTVFDEDWLEEVLDVYEDGAGGLDVTQLRHAVQEWFDEETLKTYCGDAQGQAAVLALEWMSDAGKRYRPMLAAGVYAALTAAAVRDLPDVLRQAAVAVECFHKASLVHDDIEDGDVSRYDKPTLHERYGVPVALNAGDYLVGLGYRLLSELDCTDAQKVDILKVASEGHRLLCVGQGEELACIANKQTPSVEKVLSIFSQKTAPAFAVALKIAGILADADETLLEAMDDYSEAIGVAYQIRDDLQDHRAGLEHKELSIVDSLALKMKTEDALQKAQSLLDDYRRQAIASLDAIEQSDCKAFLRKVITKIFDGTERMGCCDEYSPESD